MQYRPVALARPLDSPRRETPCAARPRPHRLPEPHWPRILGAPPRLSHRPEAGKGRRLPVRRQRMALLPGRGHGMPCRRFRAAAGRESPELGERKWRLGRWLESPEPRPPPRPDSMPQLRVSTFRAERARDWPAPAHPVPSPARKSPAVPRIGLRPGLAAFPSFQRWAANGAHPWYGPCVHESGSCRVSLKVGNWGAGGTKRRYG